MKLKPHEDGSVSVRITPIDNGFLVKPGGGQAPVFYPTVGAAVDAAADAMHDALEPEEPTDHSKPPPFRDTIETPPGAL
jgi:hypothetical protein